MNRNALMQHIRLHISKAGSLNLFAKLYGLNAGAVSAIMSGTYQADEGKMLAMIANKLNYKERNWVTVRTTLNYQMVSNACESAREQTMWLAISNKAGSGKSEALEDIFNLDDKGSTVLVQCAEWGARQFLTRLAERTVGLQSLSKKGYLSVEELQMMICDWFNERSGSAPLLIIDEADKLRPSALRCLIVIYNRTEHRIGAVLSGTENLEKEIEKGVRLKKKGYDEIDSRLGRSYITLPGAIFKDVEAICKANGVEDKEQIEAIWGKLDKVKKRVEGAKKLVEIEVVEDYRRLVRVIKSGKLRL